MGRGVRIRWRRAIGWIAAYALALQTIAVGIDLIQSAAAAATSNPTLVICHGQSADSAAEIPGSTGDGSGKAHAHCGCCCLGAPAFLAAPSPLRLRPVLLTAREIIWPRADWRDDIAVRHPSRQPRGPPPLA